MTQHLTAGSGYNIIVIRSVNNKSPFVLLFIDTFLLLLLLLQTIDCAVTSSMTCSLILRHVFVVARHYLHWLEYNPIGSCDICFHTNKVCCCCWCFCSTKAAERITDLFWMVRHDTFTHYRIVKPIVPWHSKQLERSSLGLRLKCQYFFWDGGRWWWLFTRYRLHPLQKVIIVVQVWPRSVDKTSASLTQETIARQQKWKASSWQGEWMKYQRKVIDFFFFSSVFILCTSFDHLVGKTSMTVSEQCKNFITITYNPKKSSRHSSSVLRVISRGKSLLARENFWLVDVFSWAKKIKCFKYFVFYSALDQDIFVIIYQQWNILFIVHASPWYLFTSTEW